MEVMGHDTILNMSVFARQMLAMISWLSGLLFPGLATEDANSPLSKVGESCSNDTRGPKGQHLVAVDIVATGAA